DDIRFIRRLVRDTSTRGRTQESVINQYLKTVKPMHYKYVKPSKRYADIIIPNDKQHEVAVDIIISKIKEIINGGKI
ncbi:MAG: uridine kinase, partial [bacterium]